MLPELALDNETMHLILQKRYNKDSSKKLTKIEASDLIEFLTRMQNGEEVILQG
jgi:hypothetical protein